jgi:chorismate--pyruvate lyase
MKPAARSKASRAATSHRRPVTPSLRRWLLRGGSLSAHVHALGKRFEVQRLSQRVASLLPGEAESLGVPADTRCVVREVVLRVDGRPLIFARSVTPARALHGPWRSLGALGTRPLAQLLFDSYEVTRGPLRMQQLLPATAWRREVERGWQAATGERWGEASAWARYSIFWKAGVPLRVTEVFTPAMRTAPCPSPLQDRQAMRTAKRGKPSTSASSKSPRTTAPTPSGVPV